MQSGLCAYSEIGGKPGVGMHSHFLGVAWVDVLGTALIAWAVSRAFGFNVWKTGAAFFALGIVVHRLLCVRSTVDRLLFPNAL
jgi:hypothetical protein